MILWNCSAPATSIDPLCFTVGFGSNYYGFNKWLLSRIWASNFGQNTDYVRVVSTHNILMIVVKCANCISIIIPFLCGLNLSTNGGALADPEYVCMVAPPFEPRKKVANLCVRLRASEQISTFLQIIGLYCGCLGHLLGNIRFREMWDPTWAKKNLLPRSDGPLSSSELGENLTYIIRLSRRFLWEMHHKLTVLEILSELSEDPN